MRTNIRFLGFYVLAALLPLGAGAAPLCAMTPTGKKCLYYDVERCRAAAGGGQCVVNGDELAIAEQDKGIRYCVASSLGVQCTYNDFASCTQAAKRARGLCIDTQEKLPKNQQRNDGVIPDPQ